MGFLDTIVTWMAAQSTWIEPIILFVIFIAAIKYILSSK